MTVERTQSASAYQALEEAVVTLSLEPGTVVTEQALCERLGFGRTPVREAVQRLQVSMLVRVLPRQGILIEPVDARRILMSVDVRERIEPFVVERAARLADAFEKRRFETLAAMMEEAARAGEQRAFTQLDRECNDLVAQAARHDIAARMLTPLHAMARRLGCLTVASGGIQADGAVEAHVTLLRATARGEEATALAALDDIHAIVRDLALSLAASDPDTHQQRATL